MRFNKFIENGEAVTDLHRTLQNFKVIELTTDEERREGMHMFVSPPENTALLFKFDTSDKWQITTEGMGWNIDIHFFDEKGNLLYTEENCEPGFLIVPGKKCKYVVETIAK